MGNSTKKKSMSRFSHLTQGPPDPILGVSLAYQACTAPDKINLGVGAYRTEDGKPYVLNVVKKAEQELAHDDTVNHEYLPIDGLKEFNKVAAELIFGDVAARKEGRIATLQALSGTGSLRLAASFIHTHMGSPKVYLPKPTWGNHKKIFPAEGLEIVEYRHYKPDTRSLDFEGLKTDLNSAPSGSIVLLHACAHNPTGVDPTPEQWDEIASIMKAKNLFPLFDSAYQGFASGDLEKDALALQKFVNLGFEMIVCQSFAKNMGLYGERIGALHFVVSDAESIPVLMSNVKPLARQMYSNPPVHGARIVAKILSSEEASQEWRVELKGMADRINDMRVSLKSKLSELGTPGDWNHITNQIGMFTYTGLNEAQTEILTKEHNIFLTKDGRISMAGLNKGNVDKLAKGIHDVVTRSKL